MRRSHNKMPDFLTNNRTVYSHQKYHSLNYHIYSGITVLFLPISYLTEYKYEQRQILFLRGVYKVLC